MELSGFTENNAGRERSFSAFFYLSFFLVRGFTPEKKLGEKGCFMCFLLCFGEGGWGGFGAGGCGIPWNDGSREEWDQPLHSHFVGYMAVGQNRWYPMGSCTSHCSILVGIGMFTGGTTWKPLVRGEVANPPREPALLLGPHQKILL